jgi:hypothetical protein
MLALTTGGAAHAGLTLKGGMTRFTSDLGKVTTAEPAWGLRWTPSAGPLFGQVKLRSCVTDV